MVPGHDSDDKQLSTFAMSSFRKKWIFTMLTKQPKEKYDPEEI